MSAHLTHTLSNLPLFEGVAPERVARLVSSFSAHSYDRGDVIVDASTVARQTYIMVTGAARVTHAAADGRVVALGLLDAGDLFGSLPFDEQAAANRVDAVERCTALRIGTDDFEQLLEVEPSVAAAVIAFAHRRAHASERHLESLVLYKVPARLALLLLDLSDRYGKVTATGIRIDLRLTHGQLADLVGTTRETLTKVAGWLRAEGVASIERRIIWIADYEALRRVADERLTMPGRSQDAATLAANERDLARRGS
jgi:CRP/FNR family transcriptional regulator, cyclic AMP receptor protein